VVRPVYSPALVAFFGSSRPVVGWVALGWGEPCVPWWGRPGFIHRPWWGGWGGPRIVNNVVVHRTTVVQADHIHDYRNARVHNAVVGVHEDHFRGGGFEKERFTRVDARDFQPMRSGPRVKETPGGYGPAYRDNLRRLPEKDLKRPVATPRPTVAAGAAERREWKPGAAGSSKAVPQEVSRLQPQARENAMKTPRPPYGQSADERRPEAGRAQQPAPPKMDNVRRYPEPQPPVVHRQPQQPQPSQKLGPSERTGYPGRPGPGTVREKASPSPPQNRIEGSRPPARQQPGEPAGRFSPNRMDERSQQRVERGVRAPERFEPRKPAADAGRPAPSQGTPSRGVPRPGERPTAFPRAPGGA
jgi:hypothetical protein